MLRVKENAENYISSCQCKLELIIQINNSCVCFFLSTSSKKKKHPKVKMDIWFLERNPSYLLWSTAVLTRHFTTLRILLLTVLLHHIETSGTKLFRNMSSVYSVIIIVLCLLCISDLYLTLPVCLDTKTSFKPQLPSVS